MSEGASKIPKWVWVTTPTLAVAFAGFILYLSTIPTGDELDAVKGDAKKAFEQGIEQAKKKAAEQLPEPSYEFYKLLENQTVEVPEVEAYKSTPKDEALQTLASWSDAIESLEEKLGVRDASGSPIDR